MSHGAEQEGGGQKDEFVSWKGREDPKAAREPMVTCRWPAAFAESGVCTPGRDCFGSCFVRCIRFLMSVGPEAS